MGALHQENAITANTFGKNGLNFTVAKTLDIDFARIASVSLTDKTG